MTYITIYNPDVNPGRPRGVDLVRYRTPEHETEFLFDLRWYFRQQYLDKEAYEEHLLAAAPYNADEVAVEFALLLLTTLEPGWDTADRTFNWYGDACERSALLAHAVTHPWEWNIVGGGLVRSRRDRLVRVELRERGGRLAIVALETDRGLSGELTPLHSVARLLSPRGLTRTLFSMLPAIAEHMSVKPDWTVWGDEKAYEAVVDLPSRAYTSDVPHLKTVQEWMCDGRAAVDAAIACAEQETGANLNERS